MQRRSSGPNGFAGLLNVFPYRGGSRRCLAVPLDVPTTLTAPKERSYVGLSRRATVFIVARPENRRIVSLMSDYRVPPKNRRVSVKVQEQALIRTLTRWHGQWKIPDRYVAVRFTSVFFGGSCPALGFLSCLPLPS